MTPGSADRQQWRSYGTDPLPTPQEALGQPFVAFPSWFLLGTPAVIADALRAW